ncbi:hypothetical protein KY285_020352 [Solanum tuberosum]|nr:hypothetical protein KY285_020352 [Solanum tuberosum]
MEFPRFEGGDPRGWILKAEKYFCYYQTKEEHKVDIVAMYLEGDALDLFSWINQFQNPDEHLYNIQQTGSVQEYRQEFAKRSSRVTNWPDHCLLGVFLNGLKEELKSDVRIHKPRTVYRAMSLALEFENKLGTTRSNRVPNWTPNNRPTKHPKQFFICKSQCTQQCFIQPSRFTTSSNVNMGYREEKSYGTRTLLSLP